MIVVADAGPLIALAKIEALEVLFQLHPVLLATPAVYAEAVTQGRAQGAPDAERIETAFARGQLRLQTPAATQLALPAALGLGETQSILLALELQADWLLADDYAARAAARRNIAAAGGKTMIRGTLGILVAAVQEKLLEAGQAIALVEALKQRPDIWLSHSLCDAVIVALQQTQTTSA